MATKKNQSTSTPIIIDSLIQQYGLVSDQIEVPELRVILRELFGVLAKNIAGDVVELGCYEGTSALFIQRMLNLQHSTKAFHVYDSFEGLPEKSSADISPIGTQFTAGVLRASKKTLVSNFTKAQLKLPHIHAGWFDALRPDDMPEKIAFAFLDGDYYSSITESFLAIQHALQPGAVILIDDYANGQLPGAKKATDDWARSHSLAVRAEASLGIIRI